MLTIFAIPKPFKGHIGLIQRNAIASWTRLRPTPEVLLFGDEEGGAAAARELGVGIVPQVARNEYGTPLVDDIFAKAQRMASHDLLCYVHADMILLSEFMQVIQRARGWPWPFLMTGRRWEVDLREPVAFQQPDWEERFRRWVREAGQYSVWGIDYFVFPRGLLLPLPPLAIGRGWFDGVVVRSARSAGAKVIDASDLVMVVHQNHDYSHIPTRGPGWWHSDEAERNYELAGGGRYWLLLEATHRLTPAGPKRVWGRKFLFQAKAAAQAVLVYRTGGIRRRLGLRRTNLTRARRWVTRALTQTK